jgi:hypothetical protein
VGSKCWFCSGFISGGSAELCYRLWLSIAQREPGYLPGGGKSMLREYVSAPCKKHFTKKAISIYRLSGKVYKYGCDME